MCLYVRTVLLDIGIEFEISYMMQYLILVLRSLCAMLHCHMTSDIYFLLQKANLVILMFP